MSALPILEQGHLCHHGETLAYNVRCGRPGRVRMTLRVTPDGQVDVLLPPGAPPAGGHAMIQQRADWVVRQWQRFRQRRLDALPSEQRDRRYVLGTLCRVEWLVAHSWHGVSWQSPESSASEGRIIISAKSGAHAEALLHNWYAQKTLETACSRLACVQESIPWVTTPPPLRVRRLCRRWGSCSSRGVITLASLLYRLPVPCIDYILLHELTHLAVFNHSPAFYAKLAGLLPDWQLRRKQLEAFPSPWQPETEANLQEP